MLPILVVCYTNHALDQFLAGMLPFCEDIVRIGGCSKSDLMNAFNLRSMSRNNTTFPQQLNKNFYDCREKLKMCFDQIEAQEKYVHQLRHPNRIWNAEILNVIATFTPRLCHHFIGGRGARNQINDWLGCREIVRKRPAVGVNMNIENIEAEDPHVDQQNIEIDDDEDEINRIQNMRMADDERDDDMAMHLPRQMAANDQIQYEYELAENPGDDGFQFQNHEILRQRAQLKAQIEGTNRMELNEALNIQCLQSLPVQHRWRLYRFWLHLLLQQEENKLAMLRERYANECATLQALRKEQDLFLVRSKKIIGMTTTGAAKYRHIIDGVKPKIVSK